MIRDRAGKRIVRHSKYSMRFIGIGDLVLRPYPHSELSVVLLDGVPGVVAGIWNMCDIPAITPGTAK